jgi:hypothetical protein
MAVVIVSYFDFSNHPAPVWRSIFFQPSALQRVRSFCIASRTRCAVLGSKSRWRNINRWFDEKRLARKSGHAQAWHGFASPAIRAGLCSGS